MNIAVISVGRLKEKPYRQMADEYLKRLSRFGRYEEAEIPDLPERDGASPAEEEPPSKPGKGEGSSSGSARGTG